MSDYRLLVTGSRTWTDKTAVAQAFSWAIGVFPGVVVVDEQGSRVLWDRVTVVHGAAVGADTLAGRVAQAWGMRVETYPADWDRYGRSAGYVRNADMVKLGADLCLAFPFGMSLGTRMCMGLARDAGIRVVDWPAEGPALLATAGMAS